MDNNYLTILRMLDTGGVQDAGKMPYFQEAQLYLKLKCYITVTYDVTDKGKQYLKSLDRS